MPNTNLLSPKKAKIRLKNCLSGKISPSLVTLVALPYKTAILLPYFT